MLRFLVVVPSKDVDGMIFNRNENDPIPLCRKGNMCYEDISSNFGNTHIAEACPRVFMENRARFEEKANPLRQFLNDPYSEKLGPLVKDPDVYMKRKDLIDAYRDHCKLNGITRVPPWADDHYDLRKAKIRIAENGEINDENGDMVQEKYVFGIASRADPVTMTILSEKEAHPVDQEEDGEGGDGGMANISLIDQAITLGSQLEATLGLLTSRSGVLEGFTKDVQALVEGCSKHLATLDENSEMEYAAQGECDSDFE
jgi:hypothetical protein